MLTLTARVARYVIYLAGGTVTYAPVPRSKQQIGRVVAEDTGASLGGIRAWDGHKISEGVGTHAGSKSWVVHGARAIAD
jgi:hypothetical protein